MLKIARIVQPFSKKFQHRPSSLQYNLSACNDSLRYFSATPEVKPEAETKVETKKGGLFDKIWGVESNVASPNFKNRWLMAVPVIATHMSIGSPYAWSLVADLITKEHGFVVPAAADWTLMETALPISIVFLMHGVSAAILGKWQLKVGPRLSVALASLSFGGALMLGAAAIEMHSLPLLYLSYGVLGGTGIGFGYTPTVQTLMQWFPDKKGIASGITIAGFGSGALVFTPLIQGLIKHFAKMPEYLGPAENFVTKAIDGKMFADVNGKLVEVVQAGAAELAKIPYDLAEGLYVVGTGSTGAAEALGTMGLGYFGLILASSLLIKNPHPAYTEAMAAAAAAAQAKAAPANGPPVAVAKPPDFSVEEVMRQPQFPLLGLTFFCVATGGMGLFSVAKPMMSEVFSTALPTVVTSAFAANFVLLISAGNLGGRLGWAALSDAIGRKKTFTIFTMGSIPVYLSIPYLVESVVTTGSTLPLYAFIGCTMAAISGMGAAFAILPAYEADLFGTKHVAAVHGRMLMFSSMAGVCGPYMLLKLRSISEQNAVADLMTKISPEKFEAAFGAPMEKASELLAAKSLSISKLLVLCPPGTIDPTPHLYDTTMYTLSGMMALGCLAHSFVRPTTPKATITVEGREVKEEEVGDREVKQK